MINNVTTHSYTLSPLVNQPVGRQAVGQESTELKSSSFRAAEQTAESGRQQNRRLPGDNPSQDTEQARLASGNNSSSRNVVDEQQERKQQAQQEQREAEQKVIEKLSARDREVRSHEQAHAAVGGQYAGSPTYTYQRGPDGVSYAVGGEVSIDTSPIPNDPEATLRKAEQIARAASAPAEPSGQDRAVAAQAAKMAQEARIEINRQVGETEKIVEKETDEITLSDPEASKLAKQEELEKQKEDERRLKKQMQLESEEQSARQRSLAEIQQKNITTNRRLLEIDSFDRASSLGRLLDKTV